MLRLIAIVVAASAATASASTVKHFDPAALEANAERIVEGRVIASSTSWNATGTGLETRATIAVDVARKGPAAQTLEVVVPGGELGGARHVIVGMPSVAVGEDARWFLQSRGDGTYRVFGWSQGKWPVRVIRGKRSFAPAPVAAERSSSVLHFAPNGMVWPANEIPVEYFIQSAGSADIALPDEIAAIDAAFATWEAVPTSLLTFQNAGMTTLGMGVDDINVMLFIETGWTFGSEAAAATSLFILDGQQTADIAVNGQNFRWAIGPPNAGVTSDLLDLQAVMTHEIGHFSGLSHTERAYDTMYYSWKPWEGQRTLSIDDKLGLQSIYPALGAECGTCPSDETCTVYPLGRLCEGAPDPVGTPCNVDRVECDSFCLFTAINLSTGYCSKFCETDADCPLTHHCDEASAGTQTVKVCFSGAQPPPPPMPDCVGDDDCPGGQHCAAGECTFECASNADCEAGSICDGRGLCFAMSTGGGGCSTSSQPAGAFALLTLMLILRRRIRR